MPTDLTLQVSECFVSLQGESTYAGLPCVFIRLAGCNLRCHYCDARYTFEEVGQRQSLAELLAPVEHHPQAIVEVTGGEPLLQANLIPLLQGLVNLGRTVLLETNGSLDLAPIPAGVTTILDIKCPGSGMAEANRLENLALLKPEDEIKFVLTNRADYQWAVAFLKQQRLIERSNGRNPILFSAVANQLPPADLAAWILADELPVRLQLQLHKILWPGIGRGV